METRMFSELESLTQKIKANTATLADYKRYEILLTSGGLSHDYIFSYLYNAGYRSWEEFVAVRQQKQREHNNGALVGGILGLGLGLLLAGALNDTK